MLEYYLNSSGRVTSLSWPSCVCLEDDSDNDAEKSEYTSEDHNDKHTHETSWGLSVQEDSAWTKHAYAESADEIWDSDNETNHQVAVSAELCFLVGV